MLPPVKFQISAVGANDAIRSLGNVASAVDKFALKTIHSHQNTAAKIRSIEEKLAKDIEQLKLNGMYNDGTYKAAAKMIALEQSTSNKIIQIKQREFDKLRQMRETDLAKRMSEDNKPGGTNNPTGPLSKLFKGLGGEAETGGMSIEALAGASIETAGLAAIAAGVLLIKKAGDLVIEGMQYVAQNIAGAVLELGGSQNLQQMIVSQAHAERIAASTAVTSSSGGNSASNLSSVRRLAQGTPFSPEEVAKGQAAYVLLTHNADEFNRSFGNLSKIAVATNQSFEEVAHSAGKLRQDFKYLSDADFDRMLLGLYSQTQKGGVTFQDLTSYGRAFAAGGELQGNAADNSLDIAAWGSSIATELNRGGGMGASGYSTAMGGLISGVANDYRSSGAHKFGAEFNAEGQITNYNEMMKNFIMDQTTKLSDPEALLRGALIKNATMSLEKETGRTNFTSKEIADEAVYQMEVMRNATAVQEKLNAQYAAVMDTVENKLKVAFNNLSNMIMGYVYPLFADRVVPAVQDFINFFIANGELIKSLGESVYDWFKPIIDGALFVGKAIITIVDGWTIMFTAFVDFMVAALEKLGLPGLVKGSGLQGLQDTLHKTSELRPKIIEAWKQIENDLTGEHKAKKDALSVYAKDVQRVHVTNPGEIGEAIVEKQNDNKAGSGASHYGGNPHNPASRTYQPIGSLGRSNGN